MEAGLLLGAALGLFSAPCQQWLRSSFRHSINNIACQQVALVQRMQGLRRPWATQIHNLLALSVCTTFYITAMPLLYFLGYWHETAALVGLLAGSMAIGAATKDILCTLRPAHASRVLARLHSSRQDQPLTQPQDSASARALAAGSSTQLAAQQQPAAAQTADPAEASREGLSAKPSVESRSSDTGTCPDSHGGMQPVGGLQLVDAVDDPTGDIEYGSPSIHVLLALTMTGFASHLLFNCETCVTPIPTLKALHACYQRQPWPSQALVSATHVPEPGAVTGASAWLAGVRGTPVGWWLSIGITAGWTGLIVFNRLYQGMHTPIDCLIGAGLGLALLRAYVPLATHWVAWMVTGGLQALAIQAAVYIAALSLYPKPLAFTTSYRHATAFLSSHLGLCAAIAYGHVPHDWTMAIYQRGEALVSAVPWPPALRAALATEHGTLAMTVVWGLFTVGVVLTMSKAFFKAVLPPLFDAVPVSIRKLWQPPVTLPRRDLEAEPLETLLGVSHTQKGPGPHTAQVPSKDGHATAVVSKAQKQSSDTSNSVHGPANTTSSCGASTVSGAGKAKGGLCVAHAEPAGQQGPGQVATGQGPSCATQDCGGTNSGILRDVCGTAMDVDTVRRFLSYGIAVFACIEYTHCRYASLYGFNREGCTLRV